MRSLKILFAVAYLLMPLDLVPDFIPVLGWLDDLGILAYAFKSEEEPATAA